jgi:hypothetical protein
VNQNTAATDSGGMYVDSSLSGVVSVDNSIFSGNKVTANGYNGPVDVTMTNNNIALNEVGWNLVGTSDIMFTSVFDPARTDTPGLDTTLAANNAPPGYPPTLALLITSSGYEKGDPTLAGVSGAKGIDERGFYRQTGKVSIGAEDPDATAT